MSDISYTEKLHCVVRELGYRKHVYPRLIASGKLTQKTADRELAVMAEIVEDYRKLAATERLL